MSDSSDTSVSEHEATDEEHEDDGEQFLYMYGNVIGTFISLAIRHADVSTSFSVTV